MDNLEYERKYYLEGCNFIAGVDEVGRGPLSGPVVCCAVIMPKDTVIEGVTDSKKLTEKKREVLAEKIKQTAEAKKFCFCRFIYEIGCIFGVYVVK